MKSKTLFIALLAILIGLSSCAINNSIVKAYDGPERDKTSLALVKGYYSQKERVGTNIYQVDSIPLTLGKRRLFPKGCDILPGTHTMEIWCMNLNSKIYYLLGRALITFDAEAGKEYTIIAETRPENNIVEVYITDNQGQRVQSTVTNRYLLKEKE